MTSRVFSAQISSSVTVTTTTETVVLTLPGVSTNGAQDQVFVSGSLAMLLGTAATTLTIRVRRGTGITGTVVGVAEVDTAIPAETDGFPFDALDIPGEVAGQAYVVTVQQASATGNGSVTTCAGQISLGP